MKFLRSLLFVAWLYLSMVVIGIVLAPAVLFDRRATFLAMRTWGRAIIWGLKWMIGASVEFQGLENLPRSGPALVACKHYSMLDTVMLPMTLDDPAFVYKRELRWYPIFGWYLDRAKMFALDRGGQAQALKAMVRAARGAIAQGRQFLIFPEGTRQALTDPPDYKPGVAALYKDLGIPCVPVALNTGVVWPAHGIMRHPGKVVIRVLEPIAPGLPRDEFMRELELRIETATQDLLPPHLRRTQSA